MDFELPRLNQSEKMLWRAVQGTEPLNTTPLNLLPVRASILRRLILGEPVYLDERSPQVTIVVAPTGLILSHLHIVADTDDSGTLNLEDACASDGSALPPLSLEHCLFPHPVRMSRARLRRLSLKGSFLSHLCGDSLRVEGPLDISCITSAEDHPLLSGHPKSGAVIYGTARGLCRVQLHNAFIGDDVEAGASHFVSPPRRAVPVAEIEPNHALDLSGSEIRGRLSFGYCATALGGISISRSRIGGQLWGCGATVTAIEGPAFTASGAEIAGPVYLEYDVLVSGQWTPFIAVGLVNFHNARLGSVLYMRGAVLGGDPERKAGLIASHLQTGDSVLLCGAIRPASYDPHGKAVFFPFLCHGGIQLNDARINGNLTLNGAQLQPDWLGSALFAPGLTVTGQAALSVYKTRYDNSVLTETYPFTANGRIVLTGADFHMSLKMSGAMLYITDVTTQRYSLAANGATVGGSFYFNTENGLRDSRPTALRVLAQGSVYLQNISIRNDLDLSGSTLHASGTDGIALDLTGANIRNDLCLRSSHSPLVNHGERHRFISHGTIKLENAQIGKTLDLQGASINAGITSYAISATGFSVGATAMMIAEHGKDDSGVTHFPFEATGTIDLTAAKVATELVISGARLRATGDGLAFISDLAVIRSLTIELSDVVGHLRCEDFTASYGVRITTTRIHSGTLSLWESDLGFLDLSGLGLLSPPTDTPALDLERARIAGKLIVVETEFVRPSAESPKLAIDMRGLHVGELIDTSEAGSSLGWGTGTRLMLEGFVCERAPHRGSGDTARIDIDWLNLQYEDPKHPQLHEYAPAAYDQLARAMREEGYISQSNHVLSAKLTAKRIAEARPFAGAVGFIYHKAFNYGLSAKHALTTFLVCILFGWLAVHVAKHRNILVLTTSTVNTVVFHEGGDKAHQPADNIIGLPIIGMMHATEKPHDDEIPCGDHIDSFLYALEVFVPALDLSQTRLCEVSSQPNLWMWRWARAAYAILGWIVTSITLLTIPGILRSRAEG